MKVAMKNIILVVCTIYAVTTSSADNVEHIGCHKVLKNLTGCQFSNKADGNKYSNQMTQAVANALQWLRHQDLTSTLDIPSLSWIIGSMVTVGYVNDKGNCSSTLQEAFTKINSLEIDNITSLSGGKLAMYMIGLRASCQNVRKYKGVDLVKVLKVRMKAFPKEEFNNFFQYSLGAIALYVNGENIPSIFGEEILRGNKRSKFEITDIDSIALIALSALDRQTFVSHWVRKHIQKQQKKTKKKLEGVFRRTTSWNPVSSALLLQSLHAIQADLHEPWCRYLYDPFMDKLSAGSLGYAMTTSYVLLALNEQSILDLRNVKCPLPKDNIDEDQLKGVFSTDKQREQRLEKAKERNIKNDVNATQEHNVRARLVFNLPNYAEQEQMVRVADGASALDVLIEAASHNPCFHHVTKNTAYGKQITTICKTEQNHNKRRYWIYNVNNVSPSIGAGKYKVKDGDIVTFSYKKF